VDRRTIGVFVGLGRKLRREFGRKYRIAGALTLLVAAGAAILAPSGPAAAHSLAPQGKVVTYLGRAFTVPVSWPVVDLGAHPSACVRFDVHAVYLGVPGPEQDCPARGAGRHTGALLIQPSLTRSSTNAIIALEHRVSAEIEVTAPNFNVTASYGEDDRSAVLDALSAAGLPQPAPQALAPQFPDLADLADLPDLPNLAAAHDSAPVEIVQGTILVTGLGFDTCTAPSAGQMKAWVASPYNTVGIYIGGSERACAQPNLTRSWITARAAAGWHFIPLYVGWQAAWDSLTATAPATLGRQDADDAAARAQRLGIGRGALLYYDMESYKTTAQGNAATAFLSAWTAELHAKGYRSAVYSSASTGIADLVARRGKMTEPDVVEIAHWNGVADADPKSTPANAWPMQRAHQYVGNTTGTYGGVKISIDKDYMSVNLPACTAPPTRPAPTPTPTATATPATTPSPVLPAPSASPLPSGAVPSPSASRAPAAPSPANPSGMPELPGTASNRLGAC
jgi:hypothetical protein